MTFEREPRAFGATPYGAVASKNGRVAVALPFGDIAKLAGAAMALIIAGIGLIIWPIFIFWTEIAWAVTIYGIIWWVRRIIRAYRGQA